jgi:hypothetical protein
LLLKQILVFLNLFQLFFQGKIILLGCIEFFRVLHLFLNEFFISLTECLVLVLEVLDGSDEVLRAIIASPGPLLLAIGTIEVLTVVLALPTTYLRGGVALGDLELVAGEALLHRGDTFAHGRTALLAEEVCLGRITVLW